MVKPAALVKASTNPLTVISVFGLWLAPIPRVEPPAKLIWKSQPFTWVRVTPPVAGLSMARRNSSRPAGGAVARAKGRGNEAIRIA